MTTYSVEWTTKTYGDTFTATYKDGRSSFDTKEEATAFMADLAARCEMWGSRIVNLRLITYEEIDPSTLKK